MSYLLTRNYDGYGSGFLSPNNQYFYVNISKNASSYMANILPRQGWTAARHGYDNCDYSAVEKVLVILRDPIDRWVSGVSQYLITKILNYIGPNTYIDTNNINNIEHEPISASAFIISYSSLIERFIFDNLDLLDDHVWRQNDFFINILPDVPRHYVLLNKNFEQQLSGFGIKNFTDADWNSSDVNPDKRILKKFFRDRINSNQFLLDKIRNTYNKDYQIINNVFPPTI